jgi:hypothetical protein
MKYDPRWGIQLKQKRFQVLIFYARFNRRGFERFVYSLCSFDEKGFFVFFVFSEVIYGFIGANSLNPSVEIDWLVLMKVFNDFNERTINDMHKFHISAEKFSCGFL